MKKEDAESRTILRCIVGSTVHGLSVGDQDDTDEMGIMIEPPSAVTGLGWCDHYVWRSKPEGIRSGPGDLDLTIYGLRKWMKLAVSGNPTIILPLFVPRMHCSLMTKHGNMIRDSRNKIISKNGAARCFKGYLLQQKLRLTGARGQKRVKRPELEEKYGFDTKYAAHALRLGYQGVELLTTGRLSLPMKREERQVLLDLRTGKYQMHEALQMINAVEQSLFAAFDKSDLPPEPDLEWINNFLHRIYMDYWSRS